MTLRKTGLSLALALSLAAAAPADMFKPSKGDQVKLGLRAAADLKRQQRVLPADDPRVQLLREVGGRLLAADPDARGAPWQYSFDVIQSKEMNAFALPGGPVFFYTGILDKIKTEDQLAGILAHELTHVRKEHWANAYAAQQKRSLGLSVLLMVFRANRAATDIASISNELLFTLPMSRKDETTADMTGFDTMVKAGYNPQGLADVFQMLRENAKGGRPPEFLSDHPDDKNRISRIEQKIETSGRSYSAQRPVRWSSGQG